MGFADLVPQGLRPILRSAKRKRAEILLNLSSFPFLSFFSLLEAGTPQKPASARTRSPQSVLEPLQEAASPQAASPLSRRHQHALPSPCPTRAVRPSRRPCNMSLGNEKSPFEGSGQQKRHSITRSRPITHAKRLSKGLSRATTWENGGAALCGGSAKRKVLSPKATFRNSMAVFRNPRLGWATFRSREAKRLPVTCGGQPPCTIDTNNPLMRSGRKGHRENYFSSRISRARL